MAESSSAAPPIPTESATQEEYDYRSSPLTEHERMIRLVRLLRHTDGEILYDLVPFQLSDAPEYIAISYRWGGEELCRSIAVGHTTLRITSNVNDILNDACLQPNDPGEARYLWIDFICINQSDKEEKDKQIPLMRDIYTGASQLVIYLGDDSTALLAHEFLAPFSGHCKASIFADLESPPPVIEAMVITPNPMYDTTSDEAFMRREAFVRMITHTYWTRTWIIQEIICAKQISILYGGRYVDWESLTWPIVYLLAAKESLTMTRMRSNKAQDATTRSAISCIGNILLLKETLENQPPIRYPLSFILLNTGFSQALLPQDKVLGLLGLSSDADHPDLQPNYKLSVQQVYQNATSHSLRQGRFDILSIAGLGNRQLYPSTIPGLPSWVPDFTSPGLRPTLYQWTWPYRCGGVYTEKGVVTDGHVEFLIPDCLSAKGMIVGRIIAMSTSNVPPSGWDDVSQLYEVTSSMDGADLSAFEESIDRHGRWLQPHSDIHHQIWTMVETHFREPYPLPTGLEIPRDEALWRTVVGDMLLLLQNKSPYITYPAPAKTGRWYEVFQSVCKALRTGDFVSRFKKFKENQEEWDDYNNIVDQLRITPCPFVVTDGGHMGFIVAGAKVGDVVCILRGADTPYILCPTEEDEKGPMQLVCPSYIHSFMAGEAISCGKYEERWLQIV